LQSVERHILRNFVYLHAIESQLPLPIGTQDATLLDARFADNDGGLFADSDENNDEPADENSNGAWLQTEQQFRARAADVYQEYAGPWKRRFRWLDSGRFIPDLGEDLLADIRELLGVITRCGEWDAKRDAKLARLVDLIERKHADRKVIVFTQFADTVHYVVGELQRRGVSRIAAVTGDSEDPTKLAWRFSPESNHKRNEVPSADEIEVLIATDVLSEGQNLQDSAIVVNYDLP
jgi:superfamily II DNA or RNA helicase